MQENNGGAGYDAGMRVFSYIVGGIVAWGLIGLLLDNLFDMRWLVLVGMLFGGAAGFYLAYAHGLTRPVDSTPGGTEARNRETEQ
ncbi:Putative F0F1-ATPase subunit (ATPase_gene1) [Arthrobacter saudimassiliensis]|uniref:Putative F0F1-ATPase subunit (ATPase_gene1) n=1 Tax=Arthrobacter saudimassiliensis TaxID=1461584 RepID=A0A078MMQ8_9MICC|nr:Putative F0F1-ATPase subunit (ATPase_gene1) [Arthrobacter saudimassiliensis]